MNSYLLKNIMKKTKTQRFLFVEIWMRKYECVVCALIEIIQKIFLIKNISLFQTVIMSLCSLFEKKNHNWTTQLYIPSGLNLQQFMIRKSYCCLETRSQNVISCMLKENEEKLNLSELCNSKQFSKLLIKPTNKQSFQ